MQTEKIVFTSVVLFAAVASASGGTGDNVSANVHVSAGELAEMAGDVILGAGAKFYKTGGGDLEVSLSGVNRQLGWNLTALDGRIVLKPGEDTTVDVNTPPEVLSRAKLWLDETSVVVTNGTSPWTGGTAALCAKWVDVRDKGNSGEACYAHAYPAWTGYTAANAAEYLGVPPMLTEEDGRSALFFYGAKGVHLKLSEMIVNSSQFVVHGIRKDGGMWGPVIGSSDRRGGGFLVSTSSSGNVKPYASVETHFARRMDCTAAYGKSRNYLDGMPVDPFSEKPKTGFQLLETVFAGSAQKFDAVFCNNFDGFTDAGTPQGGDCVCEIVVFSDPISESERLQVERYLMKKWNLPASGDNPYDLRYPERAGLLGASSNGVISVETASLSTPPVVFSGEGVINKSETGRLNFGLGDGAESSGRLQINGGDVFVRSGRAPAQRAQAGSTYSAAVYNSTATRTADVDAESGARLTRALGAGEGKVVKTGNDWVRFNGISADVREIRVDEGTLQLESKPRAVRYSTVGNPLCVEIGNADFETPFPAPDASNGRCTITSSGMNGWRSVSGGSYYIAWTNSAAQVWFGADGVNRTRPRGNNVLLLNGDGAVETTVTVTEPGVYEFACSAKNRYQVSYTALDFSEVKVSIAAENADPVEFAVLHASGHRFIRYRYRTPYLDAGAYTLTLRASFNKNDGATLLDDVAMTLIPETGTAVAMEIPNGDFEELIRADSKPYFPYGYSLANRAEGWTFEVTNEKYASLTDNTLVGVVSSVLHVEPAYSMYDEYSCRFGGKALAMLKSGACARTSFEVPAGDFRLRGTVANRPMNFNPGSVETEASYEGRLAASVELADGTVFDLGTVKAGSAVAREALWPAGFSVPSGQTVTLELRQTHSSGSALVDDLVLVSERNHAEEENLIAHPGCEGGNGDEWKTSYDRSFWEYSSVSHYTYTNKNTHAYGYCAFEGLKAFAINCAGTLAQTISVPEAGVYRFTCHVRTRASGAEYAGNNIRFWMTKPGSGSTNFLHTVLMPYCRNFLERSWLVDVPEDGEWILGMTGTGVSGTGAKADRWSLLDGFSFVRAVERDEVPEMPDMLNRFDVAEGARIVLDYPGSIRVRRMRLGGKAVSGVVSAATHPGFVGGCGSVTVTPLGTAVILR